MIARALVHGPVALGNLVQRRIRSNTWPGSISRRQVRVDELGQELAHRGRAAAHARRGCGTGPSPLMAHVVRHADEADHRTGPGRTDGLRHRLAGTDALQHGVRAEAIGEVLDTGHALVTPFGHYVGRAEAEGPAFARGSCRLIAMILPAPIRAADSTPSRPTAPSPTTATVMPGRTPAATAANQPVREHVGQQRQRRGAAGDALGHSDGLERGCPRPARPRAVLTPARSCVIAEIHAGPTGRRPGSCAHVLSQWSERGDHDDVAGP